MDESSAALRPLVARFRWWPQTRTGSIVQSVFLIGQFWVSLSEGFYNALYATSFAYFLYTAVRYGYLRFGGTFQGAPALPWWRNAGCAAVAAMVAMLLFFRPSDNAPSAGNLKDRFQAGMEPNKQSLFNSVHPVGTAKSIQVHDVSVLDGPNGRQAAVRFTIYWEGPVTKDGFTKVRGIYDDETSRWVRGEILETNGITNSQAVDGVVGLVGGMLEY